jgi:acyl-CoA synthetase (AMP-forming)/AMP-acid ligase II
VWLRTNSLFTSYLRNPEQTARVLVDGWLDTGDEGYLAGADLHFVARDKDLIVIGGEKYPPHDVEVAIGAVAGVRQGCIVAFGVLSEERGTEEIAAVVETYVREARAQAGLEQAIREAVTRSWARRPPSPPRQPGASKTTAASRPATTRRHGSTGSAARTPALTAAGGQGCQPRAALPRASIVESLAPPRGPPRPRLRLDPPPSTRHAARDGAYSTPSNGAGGDVLGTVRHPHPGSRREPERFDPCGASSTRRAPPRL